MAPNLHRTIIDIPSAKRAKLVDLLNAQLADTLDLYSQIKQAHWNVKGTDFIQLHEFFDELASTVLTYTDMIAERATTLGGVAVGTTRSAAASSRLPEYPLDADDGVSHLKALIERFGALAKTTRAAIGKADTQGDVDTADLFTEVSRALDKHLWFLEAHLQA